MAVSRFVQSAVVCVALVVGASASFAQTFDVQQFRPAPSQQTNYFGQHSARILGPGEFEIGLVTNYADDPLVVSEDGERVGAIVSRQLVADLLGAVGIVDWLELGIDVPIVLLQEGDAIDGIVAADGDQGGAGVGSIRLIPTLALVDLDTADSPGGPALSLTTDVLLPTGREEDWQGEGVRVAPQLVLDYAIADGPRFSGALGVMVRPGAEVENLDVDDTLTWGFGADIPVGAAQAVHLIGELTGGVALGAAQRSSEERPVELLVGGRYFTDSGVMVELGGGTGVVNGFGAPDWRILAGISYARRGDPDRDGDGIPNDEDTCPDDPEDFDGFEDIEGCPDPDNDQDTILDIHDTCPNDPEDFDGFRDDGGCPDPDNDQDGILDVSDLCPDDPEDFDEFEDANGCPDPDNDQDGILDVDDTCPNDPEDFDGFEDDDGCPDRDNDQDGLQDPADTCPNDPEDFDGFEDDDGCPEEGEGLVQLTCDAIIIADRIHFDTASDVIQPQSYRLIDQVASILQSVSYIHLVRIEGHTDDRGDDEYNLDLSQRRADSVLRYMLDAGISARRIEAVGYGEADPVASNDSSGGRAENRRVEFTILEQDNVCE